MEERRKVEKSIGKLREEGIEEARIESCLPGLRTSSYYLVCNQNTVEEGQGNLTVVAASHFEVGRSLLDRNRSIDLPCEVVARKVNLVRFLEGNFVTGKQF